MIVNIQIGTGTHVVYHQEVCYVLGLDGVGQSQVDAAT